MGAEFCSNTNQIPELSFNGFQYAFGEDNKEQKMEYFDHNIHCRNRQIQNNMADCVGKLLISKKMYKDPNMNNQPVILRSYTNQATEVKCEYFRPYKFLDEVKRQKKYKIVDLSDSRSTHVFVRDEVLQYFGVFLCFLAENTALINEIILNEANTFGIYCLSMNVNGQKQLVYIDDYILCSSSDKKPQFSQPVKGIYMWPSIIEKAWFKIKGNAAKRIEKNTPEAVFQSFLSYPLKTYKFNSDDAALNHELIRKHLQKLQKFKGYVLTSRKEPAHKLGLSGHKYYYLMASFEIQGKLLFYIRNPCGNFDFRGFHNSPSAEILQKIKSQTSEMVLGEGNFILDEDEFVEQIQSFFIYHYTKSSKVVSSENIAFDNNQQILIFTEIKDESLTSFCFNQINLNKSAVNKYCPVSYQVVNLTQNQLVAGLINEEGCFGVQNTFFFQHIYKKLAAGKYLIRIKKKARNQNKLTKQYSNLINQIIATSSNKMKFDYLKVEEINEMFQGFLKAEGKRQLEQKNREGKKPKDDIDHVVCWMGDLVFIYIEKTNLSKKQIRLEVSFPEKKNLECISHQIGNDYTGLNPFTESQLIIFEKIDLTEETQLKKYSIEAY